jgi:hypothetical protein
LDILSLLWHGVCGILYGADNILISSTPANISIQAMADLRIRGMRIAIQQIHNRDDHAGRAETTLQAMLLPKGILYGMQIAICRDAFNCGNAAAISLHCQHGTGFYGYTIHQDGARAALTGITAHVRTRQSNDFTQEMREQ